MDADDPVARHIAEFAGLEESTPNGEVPQARPMTMRQLMSHTAGFDVSAGYVKAGLRDSDLQRDDRQAGEAGPQHAAQDGPAVRPERRHPGYIVEKLSGQPLDVFCERRSSSRSG